MANAQPPTIEEITAKHAATFRADARILDLKLQREALAKRIEEAAEKDSTSVTALPMQRALQALDDLILRELGESILREGPGRA